MVVRPTDRISTLIDQDESLIDFLVTLSPAFKRLRNRAMRKVMSRLVTVEQAAAMAGLDPDALVEQLNARLDPGGASASAIPATPPPAAMPADVPSGPASVPPALARIPAEHRVELDVRPQLRAGEEPFSQIMAARREVPPGGAFAVRATFEPVPLYAVMRRQGLTHYTEELGHEDWRVWFYPSDEAPGGDESAGDAGGPAAADDEPSTAAAADGDDGVVILDVRGLEPPEPMMRTLAALEELPVGSTLVQINVRVPQFLLPILEERGFSHEIREQQADLVRLFIRRTADDPAPTTETDR